jgi:hypothetical protein
MREGMMMMGAVLGADDKWMDGRSFHMRRGIADFGQRQH